MGDGRIELKEGETGVHDFIRFNLLGTEYRDKAWEVDIPYNERRGQTHSRGAKGGIDAEKDVREHFTKTLGQGGLLSTETQLPPNEKHDMADKIIKDLNSYRTFTSIEPKRTIRCDLLRFATQADLVLRDADGVVYVVELKTSMIRNYDMGHQGALLDWVRPFLDEAKILDPEYRKARGNRDDKKYTRYLHALLQLIFTAYAYSYQQAVDYKASPATAPRPVPFESLNGILVICLGVSNPEVRRYPIKLKNYSGLINTALTKVSLRVAASQKPVWTPLSDTPPPGTTVSRRPTFPRDESGKKRGRVETEPAGGME